ncbi:MAG: protein kinase [Candidatus Melainabacteria bacterium]|nr:MAG: protein kinase [Candidatus Melainabacteria bacterium]
MTSDTEMSNQGEKGVELTKKCPACQSTYPDNFIVCQNDKVILVKIKKDKLLGQILNERYKVVEEIGRGGMSIVYKGVHELMDRLVAIKVLLPQLVSDQTSIKRFQVEAQAASCLSHPNVITIYDYGVVDDEQPFLVMDFLEGESLSDIIKRDDHVEMKRTIPIFMQAAEALEHAHQKGVIHRDLKSSNIMLINFEGKDDFVKVVDFGIAKLMPSSGKQAQHLTATGEIFGSPIYMSPEQCTGSTLDARSDIYSMGAMMYEALTGQPPIMGRSVVETMEMHLTTPPPPLKETRPDLEINESLERVVMKALSKKPEARFQKMQELRDALEGVSKLLEQEKLFGPTTGLRSTAAKTKSVPSKQENTQKSAQGKTSGVKTKAQETSRLEPARDDAPLNDATSKLNKLKELVPGQKPSFVIIAIGALLLAGVATAAGFFLSNTNVGSLLSFQNKDEGLIYYYAPASETNSKTGEVILWVKPSTGSSESAHALKLSTGSYNMDDRSAYAEGASIGDYWKISYKHVGSDNVLDEGTMIDQKSSENLRQIVGLIRSMFGILSKDDDTISGDAMMNFYTEDFAANDYQKLSETWSKETLEFQAIGDVNSAPKSALKIESFDPKKLTASVLCNTNFWIRKGPRYLRFVVIKENNKKWLIHKVEEISPTIWQQDIADGSQFDSSDSKDSGPYLKKDSEHSMGDIKNILDQEDGKSGSKREEE